jgi:PAS domain S-box-containing protein
MNMNKTKTNSEGVLLRYFLIVLAIHLLFIAVIDGLLIVFNNYSFDLNGWLYLHRDVPLLFIQYPISITSILLITYFKWKDYNKIVELGEKLKFQQQNIKKVAGFAEQIGAGDFSQNFSPSGEDDELGIALLEMRDSLVAASKSEEERNWIVIAMAQVSDILRSNADLMSMSEDLIAYLSDKINAIQGALYIVNDEDEKDVYIEMVGSYAYNKKKYLDGKFKFGQGLVGQACVELDVIHRSEIPNDYVTITSGLLGDQKPKSLLIVPIITDEKVFGAVEFAGFERFEDIHIKLIQELGEIIARTIFNVKVNENTKKLFNEIKKSQERTQVLLENASEIINIYDEQGQIKYASPSVKRILGVNPDDLIGVKELERVHSKGKETVEQLFNNLLQNPEHPITEQYSYTKPDGTRIWVESTGRNLIDNPVIGGILFNTIDITERRKAEQEQRERAKMQALSENSPDIILRLDKQLAVSYVNPVIEDFTGVSPLDFLGKSIEELNVSEQIKSDWKRFYTEVFEGNKKIADEMKFISHNEIELFMEVNAIPEADSEGDIESVLIVLHDITEAKRAELKVKEANQKVQDSINYALRIQNSILPKEIVLSDVFPNSFMIFIPKDVVSGDFPFVVQKGDYAYFAAMDCTGHGVPGALLSVIGSLILNEVLKHGDYPTASEILDELHASVVQTLRQGQEGGENERDGMDAGMCRLNMKTGELMFSGAHRPLYIVRHDQKPGEELEEIKGEKYPIGGVQYRGREKFVNFETTLQKGDRVYVCSDGYPDQFGGPDLKKIGPKKIREMLVEYKDMPIQDVKTKLYEYLIDWKGERNQMDDVLFIGVEF